LGQIRVRQRGAAGGSGAREAFAEAQVEHPAPGIPVAMNAYWKILLRSTT